MNVYQDFFKQMDAEEWEFFAIDFLYTLGFIILLEPSRGADGGKDAIVEKDGIRYIVSAKHFIISGNSVKPSDEQSISDRIMQHQVQGFIGFYSTLPSAGLINRLEGMNFTYTIFNEKSISEYLPHLDSGILQKYGLPNNIQYVMNVHPSEYQPLKCMECENDILYDEHSIRTSIATLILDNENKLEFIYGHKYCIDQYTVDYLPFIEIDQALHQDQSIAWNNTVVNYLQKYQYSNSFYQNKNEFDTKIEQRKFPSNWGKHPLSLVEW